MIVSISYLASEDKRKHVKVRNGKFTLTRNRHSRFGGRSDYKTFTAKAFVEYVKKRDPFITLEDGTKMRVYRGGNSADVVIETISVVESHDERFDRKKTKKQNKVIVPEYPDFSDYGW